MKEFFASSLHKAQVPYYYMYNCTCSKIIISVLFLYCDFDEVCLISLHTNLLFWLSFSQFFCSFVYMFDTDIGVQFLWSFFIFSVFVVIDGWYKVQLLYIVFDIMWRLGYTNRVYSTLRPYKMVDNLMNICSMNELQTFCCWIVWYAIVVPDMEV